MDSGALQQQAQSGYGDAYPNFIDRDVLISRKFIGPMNPDLLRQMLDPCCFNHPEHLALRMGRKK